MAEEKDSTEYSPEIKRALSNYFEGLTEPVSLFIGTTANKDDKEFARDGNNSLIIKTVEALRQNGVDAVPFFDDAAKLPNKVVVSKTGLQTPFVAPENAQAEAVNILSILEQHGIYSLGFVTPNTEKQLLYPSLNNDIMNEDKVIDLEKANPNPEQFQQIMNTHGEDFISTMLDEASHSPELKILDDLTAQEMDNQNRMTGCKTLYKGGTQGSNVFAVISPYEARNVPHSSPQILIAKGYSGLGTNSSSKGGATYIDKSSQRSYGFIYEIEANADQKYYANIGLETASSELDNPNKYFETPVMPHRNKVKAKYLHLGDKHNGFLYPIPENDPRWQDFMALHEPSDNTIYGNLAIRRKQQKDDAKLNGQAKTYQFSHLEGLDIPDYRDLSNIDTETLLKSLARRVDITRDESGRLVVDGYVDLEGLDIRKLPKDFANIKINGQLNLGHNPELKITSLDQLPETTQGIVTHGSNAISFGDLSNHTTEELIGKLCGTNGLKKNIDGFYPYTTINTNIDKLPQDFKDSKFEALCLSNNYEFSSLQDVPETLSGITNLKVKEQKNDLSIHQFLKKTLGNCYMGTVEYQGVFYGGNMQGKVPDDYVPTQIQGNLDFSQTNIHTFPKEMKNIHCQSLLLNPDCQFTNLDNFPTTDRGIQGLQLTSISDTETTRSFLEKIYGTQNLAANSHTTQNGNIVIHNDLWLGFNNHITANAFPHDFSSLQIGGNITIGERGNRVTIEESLQPTEGFLKKDKQIDLSGYKNEIRFEHSDLRNAEEVILPQQLEKLSFNTITLPSIKLDCSGTKNLKISEYSNLSSAQLIMPQQADSITIQDSQLPNGPVEIKNAKNVEISNSNLKKTDLSISDVSGLTLSDINLNSQSKIDTSKASWVHLHQCDISNARAVIFPTSPESTINLYEVKLPQGNYDFSALQKPFSLSCIEFTPDSTLKLPQIELAPDKLGWGSYDINVPEAYQFEIAYPGVKFPKMEWNLFEFKNNGLSPEAFDKIKPYCEETVFADKNINLSRADLSLVQGFKLPSKMTSLDVSDTIFPEGNLDLSGTKFLNICDADFSKCDQIKFPEQISKLDFHLNKFKPGTELDISGAERVNLWVQDFTNLKSLKLNPEAEINIGRSQMPADIDLDLSQSKSITISESDLSKLKSLHLPEGFDISTNIKDCQLPPEVYIGNERYIAPQTETKEAQAVEDKIKPAEEKPVEKIEPQVQTPVQEKTMETQAAPERSQAPAPEKKRKGNKLVQLIQRLRGIDTHSAKATTADKSQVIDFTNQSLPEDRTSDIAALGVEPTNKQNSSPQIPKHVKRLINIARGIIQPKKTPSNMPKSDTNTLSQSQMAQKASDRSYH